MFNCFNCGYKSEEEIEFCPACGSPLTQVQQPKPDPVKEQNLYRPNLYPRQDPFQPSPYQRQNPFHQSPYQRQDPFQKPNTYPQSYQQRLHFSHIAEQSHVKFIFVNSLIFFIIFAIRSIVALITLAELAFYDYEYLDEAQNYINLMGLSGIVTLITFAGILIVFILSVKSKKIQSPLVRRLSLARKLFIFTITSLLLGMVCISSEILVIVEKNNLIAQGLLEPELFPSIISCIFFYALVFGFGITNVIKAKLFISKLEELSRNKQL